jgi:hypothetical protein
LDGTGIFDPVGLNRRDAGLVVAARPRGVSFYPYCLKLAMICTDSDRVQSRQTRWRRWDLIRPEQALKGVQMRQARVFLVEDEALIRLMLAEMIEELGIKS